MKKKNINYNKRAIFQSKPAVGNGKSPRLTECNTRTSFKNKLPMTAKIHGRATKKYKTPNPLRIIYQWKQGHNNQVAPAIAVLTGNNFKK